MKIYLINQNKKLQSHLDHLKTLNVLPYDKAKLTEKTTTIEINTNKKIEDLDLGFLFRYKIFPERILTYLTQWQDEHRKMKIGDTIAQQIYIPPIKILSQKIIVGVRVNEIITQPNKMGFSYETLEGHVEKGASTFTVEQLENHKIIFKIQTSSSPGNILIKILAPVFSIPYQAFCTRVALNNVKKQIENQ